MDHREQMQKEAEQWQGTAIKIIQRFRYGLLIAACFGVLILVLQNLGFPQDVNETLPVMVITEDGQTLECTLEIRGEVTNYPLNKGKYSMDDSVVVYANGKRLLLVSFNGDRSTGFIFTQNQNAVCMMSVQRDALILETDIRNIFPEMDSQRCLLYSGYDSFDLPSEYAQYFTFLQK